MTEKRLPHLVTDTDDFLNDPASALGCPRSRLGESRYGVEIFSYELARAAFHDRRMTPRNVDYFAARGASPLILEFIREGNLNFMAPEKHDRVRAVLGKAFTRTRIEDFRPVMQAIADDLIEGFIGRGECDLVADFCHLYPISIFAQFMGVPATDVPIFAEATVQLRMLGQVPFGPGIPALEAALSLLRDYVSRLVAERRADPRDGFVDALIALQDAGEKISEEELIWGLVFLLLAGHDTTRFTLANLFHSLIRFGLWDDVAAHPERAPDAVAESMRIRPGTPRQIRVVAESFEMDGHRLQVDDVVSLNLAAAGQDPESFEAASEFRLSRDPAYLIGFGWGRHICLGQLLAKTEMAVAVVAVTDAITAVELTAPCRTKPTGVIGGFDSLPVRFEPRGARR